MLEERTKHNSVKGNVFTSNSFLWFKYIHALWKCFYPARAFAGLLGSKACFTFVQNRLCFLK